MRRRSRTRVAALAAVGALAAAGLIQYAPDVVALAQAKHHTGPRPPDDWSKKGSFLSADQANPSVVEVLGSDGSPYCSGAVVHSPGADIVITAAHCVYGDNSYASALSVAPGRTGGKSPHGTWQVDKIWVDPHYTKDNDEQYDYAFLRVSRSGGPEIEDAVGGNTLQVNQPYHLRGITTIGYPDSNNPGDAQLSCNLETFQSGAHDQYREMRCGGYSAGVSGGPWLELAPGAKTGALVGVIGGWNGGGPADDDPHVDDISYSPYFTDATKALLTQAINDDGGQTEN
ncbi:trypsin-like serine peptidase [Streptomyces sp. NPDC054933]